MIFNLFYTLIASYYRESLALTGELPTPPTYHPTLSRRPSILLSLAAPPPSTFLEILVVEVTWQPTLDFDGFYTRLPSTIEAGLQPLQGSTKLQYHMVSSRIDSVDVSLQELESLVREVGTFLVRHSLNLPLVPGLTPTCGICAQVGHSHRICPVKPVGHYCLRCSQEAHLRPK